jgi:hypothetical protein
MKRTLTILGVIAALGPVILAQGQPPALRRVVGERLSAQLQLDTRAQTTTATTTLTFTGNDGGPVLTVDFITRYAGLGQATAAPKAVDIIVTQHPVDEDAPEMTMSVNGESLPLVARLHSRRSVVATISFDDFVRLATSERLVERAFGTELEFSDPQLRMLRSESQRWSGR